MRTLRRSSFDTRSAEQKFLPHTRISCAQPLSSVTALCPAPRAEPCTPHWLRAPVEVQRSSKPSEQAFQRIAASFRSRASGWRASCTVLSLRSIGAARRLSGNSFLQRTQETITVNEYDRFTQAKDAAREIKDTVKEGAEQVASTARAAAANVADT